jgi:ketosteroid isomerase-like protein
MREFMDPIDGLSFAGGEPARGADAIYAAHGGARPGGTLTWTPSEVFAAEAGDMGATWGHFRFTPPAPGATPVTGRYVTVWRKSPAGAWKALVDIGNPD